MVGLNIFTRMKRVVLLILLVALTAAVIGCTQPASSGAPAAPVQTTAETPALTPAPDTTPETPTPLPTTEITAVPAESSEIPASAGLTTIRTITGIGDETVTNVSVPSSYWELWYTADPLTMGGQDAQSVASASAVFPSLTITIVDHDTGKVFDTVQPPGGLDSTLWERVGDPRPWSQKYYSGNAVYDFDISGKNLRSYTLDIRVRS